MPLIPMPVQLIYYKSVYNRKIPPEYNIEHHQSIEIKHRNQWSWCIIQGFNNALKCVYIIIKKGHMFLAMAITAQIINILNVSRLRANYVFKMSHMHACLQNVRNPPCGKPPRTRSAVLQDKNDPAFFEVYKKWY